jgi:hypothetical protein
VTGNSITGTIKYQMENNPKYFGNLKKLFSDGSEEQLFFKLFFLWAA